VSAPPALARKLNKAKEAAEKRKRAQSNNSDRGGPAPRGTATTSPAEAASQLGILSQPGWFGAAQRAANFV